MKESSRARSNQGTVEGQDKRSKSGVHALKELNWQGVCVHVHRFQGSRFEDQIAKQLVETALEGKRARETTTSQDRYPRKKKQEYELSWDGALNTRKTSETNTVSDLVEDLLKYHRNTGCTVANHKHAIPLPAQEFYLFRTAIHSALVDISPARPTEPPALRTQLPRCFHLHRLDIQRLFFVSPSLNTSSSGHLTGRDSHAIGSLTQPLTRERHQREPPRLRPAPWLRNVLPKHRRLRPHAQCPTLVGYSTSSPPCVD